MAITPLVCTKRIWCAQNETLKEKLKAKEKEHEEKLKAKDEENKAKVCVSYVRVCEARRVVLSFSRCYRCNCF